MRGEEQSSQSGSPWALDQRSLLAVAGIALGAILLFAIASAVDLSSLGRVAPVPGGTIPLAADGATTGAGSSLGSGGGLDPFLGADPDIEFRPIPGCPDGFALSDRIFVIPDPEACGFRPMAPGERGDHPISGIIIVPRSDGTIGGLNLDVPGRPSIRPDGLERESDYALSARPDGSFEVAAPSGDRLSVEPGVDGRMRISETPRTSASAGSGSTQDRAASSETDQGTLPSSAGSDSSNSDSTGLQPGADSDPARSGDPEPSGNQDPGESRTTPRVTPPSADRTSSPDAPVLAIVVMVVLLGGLLLAGLAVTPKRRSSASSQLVGLGRSRQPEAKQDFTYEVNALDLLLHEIEHEHDPRRAIVKCFAALETGLGDPYMARRRSETPGQFVQRVLGHFEVLDAPLSELVQLFERARFSEHVITPAMRVRAIELLSSVRHHYAAQAAAAEAAAAQAELAAADEAAHAGQPVGVGAS